MVNTANALFDRYQILGQVEVDQGIAEPHVVRAAGFSEQQHRYSLPVSGNDSAFIGTWERAFDTGEEDALIAKQSVHMVQRFPVMDKIISGLTQQ